MYWYFPQFLLLAVHGLLDYWVPMREHDAKTGRLGTCGNKHECESRFIGNLMVQLIELL